jgi:glycine hydroxymethyltransferase
VSDAVYPGLVANYDLARLLPLGAAAVRHARAGGAYADACLANAAALAAALIDAGLPVVGGGTASHHVAVDAGGFGGGPAAARTLAEANVLLSEIGIPRDPRGGIRLGTQTVTRQGFTPDDLTDAGVLIADALRSDDPASLRGRTRELRRRRTGVREFG